MYRHRGDRGSSFGRRIAVGDQYADLTVVEILGRRPGSPNTNVYVRCRCSCRGHFGPGWRVVRADNLRAWKTTSCGCFRSYLEGDLRSGLQGTAARGRYRTYVVKAGQLLEGQEALAALPWPAGARVAEG